MSDDWQCPDCGHARGIHSATGCPLLPCRCTSPPAPAAAVPEAQDGREALDLIPSLMEWRSSLAWDSTRAGWYYTTTQDWARLDDALHAAIAASAAVREGERERTAAALREVEALHAGMHRCVGNYYTEDPTYRGSIAVHGPCPTLAIIRTLAAPEGTEQ